MRRDFPQRRATIKAANVDDNPQGLTSDDVLYAEIATIDALDVAKGKLTAALEQQESRPSLMIVLPAGFKRDAHEDTLTRTVSEGFNWLALGKNHATAASRTPDMSMMGQLGRFYGRKAVSPSSSPQEQR
jgi:hypothetical protein